MKPQDFCCLPWCGTSHGAPYKTGIIAGERVTYPEGIDFHHTRGRKNPEGVYICHGCHMQHHSGTRPLAFRDELTDVPWVRMGGRSGVVVDWKPCIVDSGLEGA